VKGGLLYACTDPSGTGPESLFIKDPLLAFRENRTVCCTLRFGSGGHEETERPRGGS